MINKKKYKNNTYTHIYKIISKNRKAYFNFFIEKKKTYEAGICLKGSEIKSVKNGNAQIKDSYVDIINNEVYIKNMYIAPYIKSHKLNKKNYDPNRIKKLLLHKYEIKKLLKMKFIKKFSIIPIKILLYKNNIVKIVLSIAKGKKKYDKRNIEKNKKDKKKIKNYFFI